MLTGDNALRKAGYREGVEICGTIGLLDKLYEGSYIDKDEYLDCLKSLLEHKERRLPVIELEKRLNLIKEPEQ